MSPLLNYPQKSFMPGLLIRMVICIPSIHLTKLLRLRIPSINGPRLSMAPSVIFNKVKKPPQYIVFCWESYIDKQTYETSAVFGPETWLRMKTPADHTWDGDAVWYDNLLFGLSPGGKVDVWFPDVAGRPSLPVKPLKMWTLAGNEMTLCKDYVVPGGTFNFIQSTQDFIKGKTYPYGNWD
ncbi:Protein of uncharacterised function (DUF2931) [Citrobacter koseri]|uniref:Protein of uncharacterized function (DUF2931) n=1 Tax=Citrobacter koseri TaxID=545 RepID=A0A2X2V2M3_CITKO|nr:Protein of uncharacterised function (DUF2931) [Citrobacter koseri]